MKLLPILALFLFALGYVAFGIYNSVRVKQIQSGPAPSAPAVTDAASSVTAIR